MQPANPQPRWSKKSRNRKRWKSSQRLTRRPKSPPTFNTSKNPNRSSSKNRPIAVKSNNQLSLNSSRRPQLLLHNQRLKIKHLNKN